MKLSRPDLAAYALVALCLVLAAVLLALGKPLPELLQFVTVTALGAGAGVSAQTAPTPAQDPAPSPAPQPVARPLPQPLTSEPATGVFRAATHAP